MKRSHRKAHKNMKKNHKKDLSFIEAVRIYAGMPVEV